MKFIRKFDILGKSPTLNYELEETKFKTTFGGFLSILIMMICIVGLYFFGQEIWLKESPSVNISKISENNPGPFMLDFKNFDFTIYMVPSGSEPVIDFRIFTVSSEMYSFDQKGNLIRRPLDLIPCNLTNFTNLDLTNNFNIGGMFCVSRNQSVLNSSDLKIQGYYGNPGFQMIVHKFYMCDNSTSKIPCLPQDKINAFLSDAYLTFNVYDNMIQTNNFSHPTQRSMRGYYFTASTRLYTSSNLYFNQVDILSDTGLVFSQIEKQTIFENEILTNNINLISSKKIAALSFQLDNFKYIYTRNYKKVQDVAAQIGGIISGIKILAIFLSKNFTLHFFHQSLMNNYFSFDKNSRTKLHNISINVNNKNESSISKIDNFIKSKEDDFIGNFKRKNSKMIYQKYTENRKKKIILEFNPLYVLFFCQKLKCLNRNRDLTLKVELFEKAKLKIQEMFLVENYLNIFLEIDKLKYFLMNFEQIEIFDLIKNPLICENPSNDKKTLTSYILRNFNQSPPKYDEEKLTSIIDNLNSKNEDLSKKIVAAFANF